MKPTLTDKEKAAFRDMHAYQMELEKGMEKMAKIDLVIKLTIGLFILGCIIILGAVIWRTL